MLDTSHRELPRWGRPYSEMPEPPRGLLGGHLSEWLGEEHAKGVLLRLLRYAEICGPVARVSLGPVRMVSIHDARVAAEVLEDPRANFKGAAYILTRAVLDNVLLLNGEPWETHRKAYRRALRDVDIEGPANEVTLRHIERVSGTRGVVMIDEFVSRLVGDLVANIVAGRDLADDFEPHRRRIQYELAGLGIDLQCKPWAYLSPSRWIRLRQSVAAARAFFRSEAERHLATPHEPRRDIMQGFVRMAVEGELPRDADTIQDGAVNYFFTAHDVLTSSTAWCLYLLARHGDVRRRLAAELASLPKGALSKAELDGCVYLDRVIRESLRLFPGYSLFGRTTQQDMVIGGYEVKKGAMLIVSPFVIHRLARNWDRPAVFDPERWEQRSQAPLGPSARDQYMPFGSGARGCLASHLAVPIMKTIVAQVARAWDLRASPGFEPKIAYWGTAYSEAGLPVSLVTA